MSDEKKIDLNDSDASVDYELGRHVLFLCRPAAKAMSDEKNEQQPLSLEDVRLNYIPFPFNTAIYRNVYLEQRKLKSFSCFQACGTLHILISIDVLNISASARCTSCIQSNS